MRKVQRSVNISAFNVSTRFAIDPNRIGVVESAYPGCIEVHLVNYRYDTRRTAAGGDGLVIQGAIDSIHDRSQLSDRRALLAGFDEVFEVAGHYDAVVLLRPLGIGLGVNWELFQQNRYRTSRKRRVQKKHQARAATYLQKTRHKIAMLAGRLDRPANLPSGPFKLNSELHVKGTREWPRMEEPIAALTVDEARQVARNRIAQLRGLGWECGEESGHRGTLQRETSRTTAWLCLKGNTELRVAFKFGIAQGDRLVLTKFNTTPPVDPEAQKPAVKAPRGNRYQWLTAAASVLNNSTELEEMIEETLAASDVEEFADLLNEVFASLPEHPGNKATHELLLTVRELTMKDLSSEGQHPELDGEQISY